MSDAATVFGEEPGGDEQLRWPGANQIPLEIVQLVFNQINGEAMELVAKTPETLRTSFGFGRANGILLCLARFRELLNTSMDEQARKQEEWEKRDRG